MKKIILLSLIGLLPLTANAMPTTVIKFAKGSYCTSFTGDLSKGRKFKIDLGAGQEFNVETSSLDGNYVASVIDSQGIYLEDQGPVDEYRYFTRNKGIHTVRIAGQSQGNTAVKFCAY